MKNVLAVLFVLFSAAIVAWAAGLDGDWSFTFETEDGVREAKITLHANGTEVTGKIHNVDDGEVDVKGTFSDGEVYLLFPYYSDDAGVKSEVKIKGKLEADTIKGDWQFDTHSGDFTAKRVE